MKKMHEIETIKDVSYLGTSFSGKTILLSYEGEKEWFPLSLVEYDAANKELQAPLWLLEEKGWNP